MIQRCVVDDFGDVIDSSRRPEGPGGPAVSRFVSVQVEPASRSAFRLPPTSFHSPFSIHDSFFFQPLSSSLSTLHTPTSAPPLPILTSHLDCVALLPPSAPLSLSSPHSLPCFITHLSYPPPATPPPLPLNDSIIPLLFSIYPPHPALSLTHLLAIRSIPFFPPPVFSV